MMFVQYFIWGAWAPTLGNYMSAEGIGDWIRLAYALGRLPALLGHFFLGMVADLFFDSEKLLGVLMLIAGAAHVYDAINCRDESFPSALGVTCTLLFPNPRTHGFVGLSSSKESGEGIPCGSCLWTIGWAAIGLFMGYVSRQMLLRLRFISEEVPHSFLVCIVLHFPYTPPPSRGQSTSWKQIAGIDAFNALKSKSFVVFLAAAMLIFIAFGTYFPYAPLYFSAINAEVLRTQTSLPTPVGRWRGGR